MVWFTRTRTDVLLACDAPGCASVLAQDASGFYAVTAAARSADWNVGGLAYCPRHREMMPTSVIISQTKQDRRRAEILKTHPPSREYTG